MSALFWLVRDFVGVTEARSVMTLCFFRARSNRPGWPRIVSAPWAVFVACVFQRFETAVGTRPIASELTSFARATVVLPER